MSVFYLYLEAEFFHRKFDCCDLIKATYYFKHIFEPVLWVSYQQFFILPAECIYVILKILRTLIWWLYKDN